MTVVYRIPVTHTEPDMDRLSKEQFLEILRRYLQGQASPEEASLIEAYYRAFDVRPDISGELSAFEQEHLEAAIREGVAQRLNQQRAAPRLPFRQRIKWISRVAAAIVIVTIGSLYFITRSKTEAPPILSRVPSQQSAPRTNNLVQLADGSTVILSPGSRLDYPDSFDGMEKREVFLTGEAFFDIQHQPEKPFIVRSGKLVTTVLGTSFSVKALPHEKSITVTVTSGKVAVSDHVRTFGVLLPDQQAVYDVEQGGIKQQTVAAEKAVEWKKDDLLFDDVTVANAARLIEERFDMTIHISDDQLKNKRFTTTFGKSEPLESVLNSIAVFNDATYRIDMEKRLIIISPQ